MFALKVCYDSGLVSTELFLQRKVSKKLKEKFVCVCAFKLNFVLSDNLRHIYNSQLHVLSV